MEKNNILLEVKHLKKYFPLNKNLLGKPSAYLKAVDDVSFKLESGKTIGVVGESGCGKTTLGRTILQLYDTTGGKTIYYGHTVTEYLPKYYLDDIKRLPSLAKRLGNLIKILNDSKLYSEDFVLDQLVDNLDELNNHIDELNSLTEKSLETEEEIKVLKNKSKTLSRIINILSTAAVATGGAVLYSDYALDYANLALTKLKLENEKLKKEDSEILKLDEINANLKNITTNFVKSPLFNDLESLIETGLDLARINKKEMRSLRTEIQLIFQDPYSSLPPRMTVGSILKEPVSVHKIVPKEEISNHVRQIMKKCGLQPQYYDRYPHEFSGGQRQRICIARALAVNPKLVICDEPVSALDVSIQAQIINLLKQLQKELGLTYMFISHDLSVVKYITDSIIVMYLGNMMEIGDSKDIFKNPLHPYTQALFSAVPVPDPDAKMQRIILKGDIPSPANPPKGCKFHTRCEKCMSVCKLKKPEFIKADGNHMVACHLYDKEVMANLAKYDAILAYEQAKILEEEKALDAKKKK